MVEIDNYNFFKSEYKAPAHRMAGRNKLLLRLAAVLDGAVGYVISFCMADLRHF
jgi:hypothetical protein